MERIAHGCAVKPSAPSGKVDAKPRSLEEAMDRCRERLSLALADEGMNEHHDMLVMKRNARKGTIPIRTP